MKTKTSILTALVAIASGTGAMAQVYSQNVVGYVNVEVPTGFSMIANQLQAENNTLAALLPAGSVPDGTTVYKWNGAAFVSRTYDALDEAWIPDGNITVAPGEGLFVNNASGAPFTVTFVGEVAQGELVNPLPAGFAIASSQTPQAGGVDFLGFPQVDGATIYQFKNELNTYVSATYDGLDEAWIPATPNVEVGEAFWVSLPQSANWTRTFSVN